MAFDAFISYSHAADGELAPALQRGLQQLAKPWTRRQALRIFRDDTGLSVNPALWQSITNALDESEYFVLLASPGAAQSEWVNREIQYWMSSRPDAASRVLPVLTAGTWAWDEATGDIDWTSSTAAPAALAGVFAGEPRHLDLAWAQSQDDLDLRNTRFRDSVADLAAPIHGIPKDELESEDVRQHRRALRLRRGAVAALLLLVVGLGVAGVLALRAADTARGALRDLEDANGNIDQLTAEGVALEEANRQAADDLATTEAARADAEELAATAREEAAAAEEARQSAEDAQATAEAAKLDAEEAQATAESARATAETAREEAEAAQASAEQDRDAAEQAAAEAAQAEAEALAAEQAAQAAEAQARADEQAALDAGDVARQQEAEAREAQAAAQAGERVARAAEAAAVAAEDAAVAAEAVARAEEQQARAAAAAAEEAAAVAQQLREAAEAAALSVSIARAAAEQTDPSLNALLSVESYCALTSCDASGQSLGIAASSEAVTTQVTPSQLDPLVAMIESVSTHHDVVGPLLGWTGRTIDIAMSDDGGTIAVLGDDGRVVVWAGPGASPNTLASGDVIGIDVSDDGTRIAYVTSSYLETTSGGPTGVNETISVIDLAGGSHARGDLDIDPLGSPSGAVDLSFEPGSHDIVLIDYGSSLKLFDPSIEPLPEQERPDYRIEGSQAVWLPDGRLAFFQPGVGYLARPDGSQRTNLSSIHGATPVVATRAGSAIVVGYDDGSLGVVLLTELYMNTRRVHVAPVDELAIGDDGRTVVSSGTDGSVLRTGLEHHSLTTTSEILRSRPPVPLATPRGDLVLVGVDERVERRTASNSWTGSFVRSNVVARPGGGGDLLTLTPAAFLEVVSPERTVAVGGADGPGVISDDGSTLAVGGSRLRIGPVASFQDARSLPLMTEEFLAGPLALSADGTTAAAVVDIHSFERNVLVLDGPTAERRTTIRIRDSWDDPQSVEIMGLSVSDDAVIVQRQRDDPTSFLRADRIEIYALDGTLIRSIPDRRDGSPMWLSSDAGLLYVAGASGLVTAYPLDGGDPTDVIDVGSNDAVTAVGSGPSGSDLMVVGYESGRVELWNLASAEFIVELSPHVGPVSQAVIGEAAAGLRVTTRSGNQAVVRTLTDPSLLRRTLCALSGRDLGEAEWRRFIGVGAPQPCARTRLSSAWAQAAVDRLAVLADQAGAGTGSRSRGSRRRPCWRRRCCRSVAVVDDVDL